MAKICKKCTASVNSKSMECPYCGSTKFESEFIEPVKNDVQHLHQKDQNEGMYSNNLEQLINLALSDGELTEKEKQVLFKKAEAEGIDLDEFEMVLDSKLKQLQFSGSQMTSQNANTQQSAPPPPIPTYMDSPTIPSREAYSQLEYLIDMGLKDGNISDLERQTIIEKGLSLGISQNEIEMILTNKINEKEKLIAQTAAPKSDKFGDVKKCPACGAIAQSFQTKCSDCGHEFSNIGANVSIGKLFEMLNACENERKEESNSITGAFGSLMAKGLGQGDKVTEKKKSIISGFPIPNTKDDILEFLSTAIPNSKQKGNMFTKQQPENKSHNDLAPTWKSKCEQIIMKAKFSMKDDKKTLEEIMAYANELGIK